MTRAEWDPAHEARAVVARLVGAIELLQVLAVKVALHGPFWRLVAASTSVASATWKTRRFEQRWSALLERT